MKPHFYQQIAESYQSGETVANPPDTRRAYRLMHMRNRRLFEQIPVPVEFQSRDPYDDYHDMRLHVWDEGVLRVFDGGTSAEHTSHRENVIARAVHDWYGHLSLNCDFSLGGEVTKWVNNCQYYPPEVHQLLFAEVVAQRCVTSYVGGFDYQQQAVISPPEQVRQICDYYGHDLPSGWNYYETA